MRIKVRPRVYPQEGSQARARKWPIPFLLCAALLISYVSTAADDSSMNHSHHQHHMQQNTDSATGPKVASVSITIPETSLIDQDGRNVQVVSEIIADKLVYMTTIYTTCTTICLPIGVNLARLQKILSDEIGAQTVRDKLVLLTISIDPAVDTPQRLNAWKDQFNGGPGWTLLTGPSNDVDDLLKATGLFIADFKDHSPIGLLGRIDSQQWTRISSLAKPQEIAELIKQQLSEGQEPLAQAQ
jgi:protein SCO1/2